MELASYQALCSTTAGAHSDDDSDVSSHHTSTVKIHVPTTSRLSRWSHIEDLDDFFSNIYYYHQKHGFLCILLKGCFELVKVMYTLLFCLFLLYFVHYDILFHDRLPPSNPSNSSSGGIVPKVTLSDVICPLDECFKNISFTTWLCIDLIVLYWIFRLIKLLYNLYHFWDIKQFFNIALEISDDELDNVTWYEIQRKVCEVQREQQMCIRKVDLTELDIYHRILRSKNYMVAMVNKCLLPVHHNIPIIGSVCYLSQGLKFNIEQLLFCGPWGFFENWNLKEDYKKLNKRHELATRLQRTIVWFAITNLLFGVFIFVWQLVYFLFNYAEVLKREPGVLGLRCWSVYGRLYLRHLNELDHELDARLRRAHRPAARYMNSFSSPLIIIIAQNAIFLAGSVVAVLVVLTVYDEHVLLVEHVLSIITIFGAFIAICRAVIPDENMCWCPESLMVEILAEVHYLPDNWRGYTHTSRVRDQFSNFFQYKAVYLLFELLSPIVTPFVLLVKLRPLSLHIIDFYRNFTVTIVGVGDVCSFSLMDTRKHGSPTWQQVVKDKHHVSHTADNDNDNVDDVHADVDDLTAKNGKTELSLIHFVTMNPTWQPTQPEQLDFIEQVKHQKSSWQQLAVPDDKHSHALQALSATLSVIIPEPSLTSISDMRRSRTEGPSADPHVALSYYNSLLNDNGPAAGASHNHIINGARSVIFAGATNTTSIPSISMSIDALYLHSLHLKNMCEDNRTNQRGQQNRRTREVSRILTSRGSTATAVVAGPSGSEGGRTAYEGTPLLLASPPSTRTIP